MALVTFIAGSDFTVNALGGSGLGFYAAASFGASVPVGSFNERTFITDSTGTVQNAEVDNCKWISTSGVILGQSGSGINLRQVPNYLSTLNIRFTHGSNVRTQNTKIYGYDRVNKNNNPSGVSLYAASIVHASSTQSLTGSGSSVWTNLTGSGNTLTLWTSPGTSGLSPNGASTSDTQHDWYVALSATPTNVGSSEFGLWFETEFI